MLSTILWVLGIILALVILYFVGVFIFMILGLRSMFHFAKDELNQLPKDYHNLRKEVKNENVSQGTEVFLKSVFVRWYHKLFK